MSWLDNLWLVVFVLVLVAVILFLIEAVAR